MTPIFNALYKAQNVKHLNQRFNDTACVVNLLKQTHTLCFDIEDVYDAVVDLVADLEIWEADQDYFCQRTRLPADGVWLECKDFAFFVTNGRDQDHFKIKICTKKGSCYVSKDREDSICSLVLAALWLINVPNHVRLTKISSKKKHRKSAATATWMNGEYTKVQLCIDGKVIDVNTSNDSHGMRPYHHVRGHLRKLFNKQVYVNHHWRGNKEIGIKHSQYNCFSNA